MEKNKVSSCEKDALECQTEESADVKGEDLEAVNAGISDSLDHGDKWECVICKTTNDAAVYFCKKCGTPFKCG